MTRRATPPPPPGSERRRHPRFDVLAQIEIRGTDSTLVLPLRNISLGGAYVEFDSDDPDAIEPALTAGTRASIFIDASAAEASGDDASEADSAPGDQDGGGDGEQDSGSLAVTLDAEILRITFPTGAPAGIALSWELSDASARADLERVIAALRARTGA